MSSLRCATFSIAWNAATVSPRKSAAAGGAEGGNRMARLMALIEKVSGKVDEKMAAVEAQADKLSSDSSKGDQTKLQTAMMELQDMMSLCNNLISTASNMSKMMADAEKGVIANLRA